MQRNGNGSDGKKESVSKSPEDIEASREAERDAMLNNPYEEQPSEPLVKDNNKEEKEEEEEEEEENSPEEIIKGTRTSKDATLSELSIKRHDQAVIVTADGQSFALIPTLTKPEWDEFIRDNPTYSSRGEEDKNGNIKIVIGKGAFGKVRLAKEIDNDGQLIGPFIIVKKTIFNADKPESTRTSAREYLFHKKYLGDYDFVCHTTAAAYAKNKKEGNTVYQFLEMAGFGDGDHFAKLAYGQNSPLTPDEKQAASNHLAISFLTAMAQLNHDYIYHRDMKAGNILIEADGTLKIADFGSAIKYDEKYNVELAVSNKTDPKYWPPEYDIQINIQDKTSSWQAGLVLLELYGTTIPQRGEIANINDLIANNHNIPKGMKDIITGLLNQEYMKRLGVQDALNQVNKMNLVTNNTNIKDIFTELAKPVEATQEYISTSRKEKSKNPGETKYTEITTKSTSNGSPTVFKLLNTIEDSEYNSFIKTFPGFAKRNWKHENGKRRVIIGMGSGGSGGKVRLAMSAGETDNRFYAVKKTIYDESIYIDLCEKYANLEHDYFQIKKKVEDNKTTSDIQFMEKYRSLIETIQRIEGSIDYNEFVKAYNANHNINETLSNLLTRAASELDIEDFSKVIDEKTQLDIMITAGKITHREETLNKLQSAEKEAKFHQDILLKIDTLTGCFTPTIATETTEKIVPGTTKTKKTSYQFMEIADSGNGTSLIKLLHAEPSRLTPDEKIIFLNHITESIIGIVKLMNENGIFHRDIKAENFLIDHDGTIKLSDFGSAIYVQDSDKKRLKTSKEKEVEVSEHADLRYWPKQIIGHASEANEAFSLGLALAEFHGIDLSKCGFGKHQSVIPVDVVTSSNDFALGAKLHDLLIERKSASEVYDNRDYCIKKEDAEKIKKIFAKLTGNSVPEKTKKVTFNDTLETRLFKHEQPVSPFYQSFVELERKMMNAQKSIRSARITLDLKSSDQIQTATLYQMQINRCAQELTAHSKKIQDEHKNNPTLQKNFIANITNQVLSDVITAEKTELQLLAFQRWAKIMTKVNNNHDLLSVHAIHNALTDQRLSHLYAYEKSKNQEVMTLVSSLEKNLEDLPVETNNIKKTTFNENFFKHNSLIADKSSENKVFSPDELKLPKNTKVLIKTAQPTTESFITLDTSYQSIPNPPLSSTAEIKPLSSTAEIKTAIEAEPPEEKNENAYKTDIQKAVEQIKQFQDQIQAIDQSLLKIQSDIEKYRNSLERQSHRQNGAFQNTKFTP